MLIIWGQTIKELNKTIDRLNQTIKELREQINQNSRNSSKPPSSDGLKKPTVKKDRSLREASGKKQGAQEGHEGVYLSVISKPDHTENHMHSDCDGCPYHDTCLAKACVKETRHEIDAVVTVDVTAHNLISVPECPMHGGSRTGSFPAGIRATVQYGKISRQWLLLLIQWARSVSTAHMKSCPVYLTFHLQPARSRTW